MSGGNFIFSLWRTPHQWEAPGVWRCVVCGAAWKKNPAYNCPGTPLFRGWAKVPNSYTTRAMAKKLKIKIPAGKPPDAWAIGNDSCSAYGLFAVPEELRDTLKALRQTWSGQTVLTPKRDVV